MLKTWKQIEQSRELRLWATQVVMPIVVVGTTVAMIPEFRKTVATKYNNVKEAVKNKLHK